MDLTQTQYQNDQPTKIEVITSHRKEPEKSQGMTSYEASNYHQHKQSTSESKLNHINYDIIIIGNSNVRSLDSKAVVPGAHC